jgi:hypothetical protein
LFDTTTLSRRCQIKNRSCIFNTATISRRCSIKKTVLVDPLLYYLNQRFLSYKNDFAPLQKQSFYFQFNFKPVFYFQFIFITLINNYYIRFKEQ